MKIDNALKDLEKAITSYKPSSSVEHVGRVISSADGVAHIDGLDTVAAGELLQFTNNVYGLALNLEEGGIGAVVLGDPTKIKENDIVKGTGRLLSIPVGDSILGRVVDPLGQTLDEKGKIKRNKFMPLERIAAGVIEREPVNTPFQTGIKAVDAMVPVGRGQRELIIGDRSTGKTAIALDSIINQAKEKTGVICIYVAIGQKASRIANVIDILKKYKAMDNTVIVSADASMPASLQYLAPYAGAAIAEYFLEQGKDSVVFYDDLSKHAWAYREVSLMLRRPSGREAYPGDIFYVHSRLLERAVKLNKKYGGGSITAFPFIETQAGDISAYIPTNVISITDGQIYLESDLFYSGIRPAINVGNSVSRVGGAAQVPIMKKAAGTLRMDLAQYRELAAFVQFATDLDAKTKQRIEQGSRMVELLKQPQFDPIPIEEQVVVIFAGTSGMLNEVPVSKIIEFEEEYRTYLRVHSKKLLNKIRKELKLTDSIKKDLEKEIKQFLQSWQPLEQSKEE